MDVRFAGANVPIEFLRHYTSLDGWQNILWDSGGVRQPSTRLAAGWFHNFDERLFAENAYSNTSAPSYGTTDLLIVHRQANARGRGFTCPAPHDPDMPGTANVSCTPDDGSSDVLRWDETAEEWEITDAAGVLTNFDTTGRLLGKHDRLGDGWTTTYSTSGDPAGLLTQVTDHLGRHLNLEYANPGEGHPAQLTRLSTDYGVVLAVFSYDPDAAYLAGVTYSASNTETYTYWQDGSTRRPLLTNIERDGNVVTSVSYDESSKVGSIIASDGSGVVPVAAEI